MPRKLCEHCQRPLAVCLCPYLVNIKAPCWLLILQHPSEQKQALATVPILQLCIEPITVLVGEDFAEHAWIQALIEAPQTCRVLFPAQGSEAWDVRDRSSADVTDIETLIIIDGTWRKAKRIWHLNPWLHDLPCVHLAGVGESQYQIRSSSIEGGVSTLEAVAHACQYLDRNGDSMTLLQPFQAMVDMQIKKMGQDVFLAHYQNRDG